MMATPDGRTPRQTGSHFGAGAPASRPAASNDQTTPAAMPSTGAVAPRSALSSGRVSSRTAAATRRAGSHSVQRAKKTSLAGKIATVVAGLAVLAALAAVAVLLVIPALAPQEGEEPPAVAAGTQVTVTIPDGSGAAAVAQLLYENGLISDQSEFLSQVRRSNAEQSLKSGTYIFTAGSDAGSIINLLTSGPNALGNALTVPEGYTVAQTAAVVESTYGIAAADFVAQAKASNYAADYDFLAGAGEDSLEGYLFPKTYTFSTEEVTADMVIRAMLDQYQIETSGIDFSSAAATLQERFGITVTEDDIITMASIVEREAVTDEQRGLVASVFYNRLASGMRLQSDATLTYSLGRAATADEINTLDDPYNTNLRDGLTPTPICSPSLASIQAACSPEDTSYFYFYITEDTEQFSETYDEHMQAYS